MLNLRNGDGSIRKEGKYIFMIHGELVMGLLYFGG